MAFSQRVVITTMMLVMAMPVFDDYHNDDDKVMSFPCLQIKAIVAFWQRRVLRQPIMARLYHVLQSILRMKYIQCNSIQ